MATTFIRYPSILTISDSSGNLINSTSNALNVYMTNSLTIGVADKTTYTYGTTTFQAVGGVYQDTTPTLTAGQSGAFRLTAYRGVHNNLRTSLGVELLAQTTSAGSIPVVIASDQSSVSVVVGSLAKANTPVINNYGTTAVTTSAYVQVVASTTSAAKEIEIFDSSGQSLYLAVGASSSEVDQVIVFPGGNGRIPLAIPASSRISLKAISATASTGSFYMNLYG